MEQKEEPPCKDGSPPACPPQIKTEPGIAVKREPGAATVKQESETARADDERMRKMLQEYRPPRRVVVRSPACQNLRRERCPRPGCPFRAVRRETVDNHVAYKHDGKNKPFKCGKCGQRYMRRDRLDSHRVKMHPKRPPRPRVERNNNSEEIGIKREVKQEGFKDYGEGKALIEQVKVEVREVEKRIAAFNGGKEMIEPPPVIPPPTYTVLDSEESDDECQIVYENV